MKRIKRLLVLSLFFIIMPMVVSAASASVGISCPTSATSGETISCNVSVTSDVKVNGVVVNYSFSGSTYVNFTPSSGFTSNYISSTGFNIGNVSGESGSYVVGVLKVKIHSAATIALKNIDISDIDFNSYSSPNRSVTIRLKSTNNNLSGLALSNGSLSPTFNANTTSYTSTINASSVTISATKGDTYQTISGTGSKTLKYGKNTFNIVVKSESGSSKTYTIVITRPDNRNSDNYLKSLTVDKGSISFKKETLNYSLNVAKDVTSIKITAAVNDSTASFVSGYGPRSVNLSYGLNKILIKVQAENEEVRTYTINVTRDDDGSTNNDLKSINLSSGSIVFTKDVTEYSMSVAYDVTKIDVVATPEDNKSKVSVASPDLVVGNNVILITVTSENGQSKVYKINVKRLNEEVSLSDNNNVLDINIKGYEYDFDPNVAKYSLFINDEDSLDVEVVLEDANASYVIKGNENLVDGSVISIIVSSDSGKTKEYTFDIGKLIKKSFNFDASHIIFFIIGFVLGLGVMFVINVFLNKRRSNNKIVSPIVKADNLVVENKVEQYIKLVQDKNDSKLVESSLNSSQNDGDTTSGNLSSFVITSPTVEQVNQGDSDDTTVSGDVVEQAKPVMTEVDVLQPISQVANVIPDNK